MGSGSCQFLGTSDCKYCEICMGCCLDVDRRDTHFYSGYRNSDCQNDPILLVNKSILLEKLNRRLT